jgi:hypothetical protein
MRATCPAHLTFLASITLILGDEHKLWRLSLCNFLQPPVTSTLLGPNILPNYMSSILYLYSLRTTHKTL